MAGPGSSPGGLRAPMWLFLDQLQLSVVLS